MLSVLTSARRGWLFGALVLGLLLAPSARAWAGPVWDVQRLPPATLAVQNVHEPASVTYHGETYLATVVNERAVVVGRLVRADGMPPVWLPVGNALVRSLGDPVARPVLHVGADGRLYVAWLERAGARWQVLTARLDESGPYRRWELLGGDALVTSEPPESGDAPALVDAAGGLWIAYESSGRVRVARLVGQRWRVSNLQLDALDGLRAFDGAVAAGESLYVAYRAYVHRWRYPGWGSMGRLGADGDDRTTELLLVRLDVAGDPDVPRPVLVAARRAEDPLNHRILGARVAPGPAGRPVLVWESDGRPLLHLEELAPSGERFVELRAIPIDVGEDRAIVGDVVLAAERDGIVAGVPVDGMSDETGLRVLRIPADPARPVDRGPLLELGGRITNVTLSIGPGGDAFAVLARRDGLAPVLISRVG